MTASRPSGSEILRLRCSCDIGVGTCTGVCGGFGEWEEDACDARPTAGLESVALRAGRRCDDDDEGG